MLPGHALQGEGGRAREDFWVDCGSMMGCLEMAARSGEVFYFLLRIKSLALHTIKHCYLGRYSPATRNIFFLFFFFL